MLNATMCAVTRVICVLLEMNQTETGLKLLVINETFTFSEIINTNSDPYPKIEKNRNCNLLIPRPP
jgi:hypothetical protein